MFFALSSIIDHSDWRMKVEAWPQVGVDPVLVVVEVRPFGLVRR